MNENKNTEVQTLNINFGVTSECVELARAYLQSGAVDKEVIMRGLGILEKAVTVIATAATRKPQAQEAQVGSLKKYTSGKVKKWWDEDKKDSCKEQDHK